MLITEIADIIEAKILTDNPNMMCHIEKVFSSDLMSDVLTLNADNLLLITGLNNVQAIRTAEMAEISTIIFIRNKIPNTEMVELAKNEKITLMISEKSMFHVSGLLYNAGLKPVF